MPVDVTDKYIRIRQRDPSDFEEGSFRTITLSEEKGIRAVIGRLKGEDSTSVQSYLFDKESWTTEEAEKWVKEHKERKSMAVKMLTEDDAGAVVGGYLLLWGNPAAKDLQGDYFTPETELMLDHYKSAPALFHHGLDDNVGLTVIGKRLEAKTDDIGVFVQNWIDKSNRYWKMVEPLLKAERLFYSPGSAPHLVKRAPDGKLLSFPVVEDTLTPVPAQYRLRPVEQIKAAYKAACLELPDLADTADAGASGVEAAKARAALEELLIQLSEET
jgi:hypothetical protein